MLVYKDGDRVHLFSCNGRDHTRRFADLAAAAVADADVEVRRASVRLQRDHLVP
jgi:hypothetical protein